MSNKARATRRAHIERVARAADRLVRQMGGGFVVEPRKLRDFVRYLKNQQETRHA